MKELYALFNELESRIPLWQKKAATVSVSPVGWHIAHSALAVARIIGSLERSDPATYRWKFNWKRSLVFALNNIPRGRGKAPGSVIPADEITPASITADIAKARDKITALERLTARHHFEHPYFGELNLKESIKFLAMHTRHHLQIVNDILKSG
ncbi:MAG: hypothetical protein K0Q66_1320 [Chitinophagaceae bacterium]|jgi:hypothetical protein|nr:hypothetical protein [Chitinophagaceae bacterium]